MQELLKPSCTQVVFPIRAKILKPGFRIIEKETRENSGFKMNAILTDENSIPLSNYHCCFLRNLLENY